MHEDLKPCPFCGSQAYVSGERMVFSIYCNGCQAMNGPHQTEGKAVFWWNKRHVGSAPMDLLDIEELFDEAAGADEDTHVRFARLVERHHNIGSTTCTKT